MSAAFKLISKPNDCLCCADCNCYTVQISGCTFSEPSVNGYYVVHCIPEDWPLGDRGQCPCAPEGNRRWLGSCCACTERDGQGGLAGSWELWLFLSATINGANEDWVLEVCGPWLITQTIAKWTATAALGTDPSELTWTKISGDGCGDPVVTKACPHCSILECGEMPCAITVDVPCIGIMDLWLAWFQNKPFPHFQTTWAWPCFGPDAVFGKTWGWRTILPVNLVPGLPPPPHPVEFISIVLFRLHSCCAPCDEAIGRFALVVAWDVETVEPGVSPLIGAWLSQPCGPCADLPDLSWSAMTGVCDDCFALFCDGAAGPTVHHAECCEGSAALEQNRYVRIFHHNIPDSGNVCYSGGPTCQDIEDWWQENPGQVRNPNPPPEWLDLPRTYQYGLLYQGSASFWDGAVELHRCYYWWASLLMPVDGSSVRVWRAITLIIDYPNTEGCDATWYVQEWCDQDGSCEALKQPSGAMPYPPYGGPCFDWCVAVSGPAKSTPPGGDDLGCGFGWKMDIYGDEHVHVV